MGLVPVEADLCADEGCKSQSRRNEYCLAVGATFVESNWIAVVCKQQRTTTRFAARRRKRMVLTRSRYSRVGAERSSAADL